MNFSLKNAVPWGRSFDEYAAMFSLSGADLKMRILGCGDGPASFNAFLSKRGGQVLSVDPLYRYPVEEVRTRIHEVYPDVIGQMRKNQHEYIWTRIKSVDELARIRMSAMEKFLADYPQGLEQGRYMDGELPKLPLDDQSFDLACVRTFSFYIANNTLATVCSADHYPGADLTAITGDCDDGDADIHPGRAEICDDATDNNCNGSIDEGCGSGDGNGV